MADEDVGSKRARWSRQAERLQWMSDVARSPDLSAIEVRLLVCIASYRNDVTGQCNPGDETLAQQIGRSVRHLQRMLKKQRKIGWINYEDNKGGRGPGGLPKTTDFILTQPRHPDVTHEQSQPRHPDVAVKGDKYRNQPRHFGGSKPGQPRHLDVTRTLREPEENLRGVAPAALVEGSRPRPKEDSKEARKEVATEEASQEES